MKLVPRPSAAEVSVADDPAVVVADGLVEAVAGPVVVDARVVVAEDATIIKVTPASLGSRAGRFSPDALVPFQQLWSNNEQRSISGGVVWLVGVAQVSTNG
jgi:hypothetical protein